MSAVFTRPYFDEDFPQLFALGFERPGETLGNDNYFRLGDSTFSIAPISIQVHTVTDNEVKPMLRTTGGTIKSNGWANRQIEIAFVVEGYNIWGVDEFELSAKKRVAPEGTAGTGLPNPFGGGTATGQSLPSAGFLRSPDINSDSLAALIAQFRRAPLLPVANQYLNAVYDIWAVALNTLAVETALSEEGTPLPNVLNVKMSLTEFEWQVMMPEIACFDDAFMWPLFRWHWQQQFKYRLPGEYRIFSYADAPPSFPVLNSSELAELHSDHFAGAAANSPKVNSILSFPRFAHLDNMSANYQFTLLDQGWIAQIADLQQLFADMMAYGQTDEFKVLPEGERTNWYLGIADLGNRIQELEGPEAARMAPVDLGTELILTHLAVGMENTFQSMRVSSNEMPTTQHLTQGDIRIVATFHAFSSDAVARLEAMISQARDIVREHRYEIIAGFVGFQNEITSLFGINAVLMTDLQSASIIGFPGQFLVSVEMIAFDRYQRRHEVVKAAADTSTFYMPGTLGFDDQNPVATPDERGFRPLEDPRYVFWSRYRTQTASTHSSQANNPASFDTVGRPTSPWFNMAYIQEAKEQLASLELYPDLQLPTWERVALALSNGEICPAGSSMEQAFYLLQQTRWVSWGSEGRFVDPDFYIDYPSTQMYSQVQTAVTETDIGPASYFDAFLAALKTVGETPNLTVDGSLAAAGIKSLWDQYPQGAFYGARANVPTQPDENTAPSHGQDRMHGIVNCPTVRNKVYTGLITPLFAHPETDGHVNIEGVQAGANTGSTHPQGGIHGQKINGALVHNPDQVEFYNHPELLLNQDDWKSKYTESTQDIFGHTQVKGKDATPDLSQALMASHPIDLGTYVADEHGRLIGMLQDMLLHDKTGRLVQAYPSYVMQLIDEGPRLGWVQIFPNFFALQCVEQFSVLNDRRDPISTLTMQISNTYGNLSNYLQARLNISAISAMTNYSDSLPTGMKIIAQDPARAVEAINYMTEGVFSYVRNLLPNPGLVEDVSALRRKQSSSVMLAPDVRIHVRAGYGANGALLPILFNGRIIDVALGESVQVIAQSDGEELQRLIPSADSEFNTVNRPSQGPLQNPVSGGTFFNYGYEPRELICQMLNSHGEDLFDYSLGHQLWNTVKDHIYKASNGSIFFENPIGITHFGNPYLFNIWNALGGKENNFDPGAIEKLGDTFPQAAGGYARAQATISKPETTWVENLIIASGNKVIGFLNPFDNGISSTTDYNSRLGLVADLFAGEMTLLTHPIAMGYGETGENVYPIYCPQDMIGKNIGSLFTERGNQHLQETMAGTPGWVAAIPPAAGAEALLQAGDFLGQEQFPDLPPLGKVTHPALVGLTRAGTAFNCYTHNKTAWDVIAMMAQFIPPYVAAVRPFEYRSTLFYGVPYWSYRYDYRRVSAYDLGQFPDEANDLYYGYPVAYKTRPFFQFHIYDSRVNLLENTIKASDEDTFTDLIAMWYGGQGYTHARPEPMAQHQTVDRSIMAALRKTVVVNTDYVGLDTAPSASAVAGSLGMAWIGYMVKHLAIGQFGINGGLNHFIAEKSVRQMARAMLRDYQKLMYQGEITVLGDPTVWPHDYLFLNDEFTDIHGLAGVRRVTHHFGLDTGFVTCIEPDLACEVKGENYLASIWTWLGGYIGTNIVGLFGAEKLLSMGRRRANSAVLRFGLKLTKKAGFISRMLRRLESAQGPISRQLGPQIADILRNGLKIDDTVIDEYRPRWLMGNLRRYLLDAIISKNSDAADFQKIAGELKTLFAGQEERFGVGAIQDEARQSILATLEKILAESLQTKGGQLFDGGPGGEAVLEALLHNLSDLGKIDLDTLIKRMSAELIAKNFLIHFLENARYAKAGTEFTTWLTEKLGAKTTAEAFAALIKLAPEARLGIAVEGFPLLMKAAVASSLLDPVAWAFQITLGYLWDAVSTWWDDDTSLMMCPLSYRGVELSAGLTGHQQSIVLQPYNRNAERFSLTGEELQTLHDMGIMNVDITHKRILLLNKNVTESNQTPSGGTSNNNQSPADDIGVTSTGPPGSVNSPLDPGTAFPPGSAARKAVLAKHDLAHSWTTAGPDLLNSVHGNVIALLDEFAQHGIRCTFSAVIQQHPNDGTRAHGHTGGWAFDVTAFNGSLTSGGSSLSDDAERAILVAIQYVHSHQIGIGSDLRSRNFGVPTGGYQFDNSYGSWGKAPQVWVFVDFPAHIHFSCTTGRGNVA